jgi:hypothetical protein
MTVVDIFLDSRLLFQHPIQYLLDFNPQNITTSQDARFFLTHKVLIFNRRHEHSIHILQGFVLFVVCDISQLTYRKSIVRVENFPYSNLPVKNYFLCRIIVVPES